VPAQGPRARELLLQGLDSIAKNLNWEKYQYLQGQMGDLPAGTSVAKQIKK